MQILNGVLSETPTTPIHGVITTTSGTATVYLTDDATSGGNALFSAITGVIASVNDSTGAFAVSSSIAGDLKSVTFTVKKLGSSSQNALITLIGGLASFLTALTYSNASNGTEVHYQVIGTLV